jgi:hypothetical protein
MSHGGNTCRNGKTINLISLMTFSALFIIVYYLFNYLRFTFVSFDDYRLAFALAILVGTISSTIYYYLGKRWLTLEVWQIIFRSVFYWSITTLVATLFFIDNVELAFQAAQIVATAFFGGIMIAVLMIINSMTNTQRTSPAQPPQANPPPQHSPVQPQTLSQTSLFPLPQPGQQVIVEIQGDRIVLTVQDNRQEVSAQT